MEIPAIRDRVVQGALKCLLEPIFEADCGSSSISKSQPADTHEPRCHETRRCALSRRNPASCA